MRWIKMPADAIAEHDKRFTPYIDAALVRLVMAESDVGVKGYYEFLLEKHRHASFATLTPFELQKLIDASNAKIFASGFKAKLVRGSKSDLYAEIDYASFHNLGSAWNAHAFIDKLGLGACPYCNAASICPSPAYPALDHYFPHAKYPFLALSIFNLIPVCSRCNSRSCKGSKFLHVWRHSNPYVDDVHSAVVFRDRFRCAEDWSESQFDENPELDVCQAAGDRSAQAENFVRAINVLGAYNVENKDEVRDFIARVRDYSEVFVRDQDAAYPGMAAYLNPRCFNRCILTEADIAHVPRSKFRLDICQQYNIP